MRTRIIVGTLLALAVGAVLIGDQWLAPVFPCLFACIAMLGLLSSRELVRLYPPIFRPNLQLTVLSVLLVLSANWYQPLAALLSLPVARSPWVPVLFAFVLAMLAAFLYELARYREPGAAVPRLALTLFTIAYIGLLPSFFAQLRWLHPDPARASLLMCLTIAVPKFGDVGAYFIGTFFGRTKMTPILSPKKTWEGATGGLLFSVAMAVGLGFIAPIFPRGLFEAVAFGVIVGIAGMLGDLAESLIKRDCQTKDASHTLPGFGGMLDVIDSVLFAAPVAYAWLHLA